MNLTHLMLRTVLGRRLPIAAGELRVRGPSAAVTIRRDRYGIPHIDAASEVDAIYALGFCQGQDRCGQLEFLVRVARGQLSEWVGAAALTTDRVCRRIGFRRAAEAQFAVLDTRVRGVMEAFAAGVTAGATAGLSAKPHEFAILGGTPTPWDGIDILAVLKLQSFILPSNWDVELARLRILLADGPAAVLALDPTTVHGTRAEQRGAEDKIAADLAAVPRARVPRADELHVPRLMKRLEEDLAEIQKYLPHGGGSNNWVIAGSRTATRQPLLASDPHLAPSAPPPWYLAHVRAPDWELAGASMTGSPGFAIGHNGFAAWGVTAGLTDNSDFFLETLAPDGSSVREADGSLSPCTVVRETIRVRGGADVVEEVRVTPRGPLLSPALRDIPLALSLRAVWLDPLPIDGFLSVGRARSYEEFRAPFDKWPLLPLNVGYADTAGNIGWFLIGQVPRRAGGSGLLPRPAVLPDTGWMGLVPFEEMPRVQNPERGYWTTANNDPLEAVAALAQLPSPSGRGVGCEGLSLAAEDPHTQPLSRRERGAPIPDWMGADYCDPYRYRAIMEALAARELWTVDDCRALQCDVRSVPWDEIRDVVLALAPADPDARDGLDLLRGWDGRIEADSAAAAVFELFLSELCVRCARLKAPHAWHAALGEAGLWEGNYNLFADRRIHHLVALLREQPAGWFASWPHELLDALGTIVRKLRLTVGPGPAYWSWGHLRQLRLEHPLFGKHRWLGPAFNLGPVPCGGDCNTIGQAGARPGHPTDFTHNMCNLRTVFDLSDLAHSRYVLCGGQSGNPWSPHHADQFPLWQAGELLTMPWDQADVIRDTVATLRLLPV